MKLANTILHYRHRNRKHKFTFKDVMRHSNLYLRKDVWEAIRKSHNWAKRGSASKLAKVLGCTRQYADMIINQKVGCSAWVIYQIVRLVNIPKGDCWCYMFVRGKEIDVDPNHPRWNYAKYEGEMPYGKYSSSAEMRKQDYDTETE